MIDLSHILFMVSAAGLCYGSIHLLQLLYHELTYPLLAGPKNPSRIFGNVKELGSETGLTKRWQQQFGPIYLFRGLFSRRRLYVADVKALSYIVANDSRFVRVPVAVSLRKRLLGEGLLTVIGDDHKRQRRILNQAFGSPQIRFLTEIFVKKAVQLRDIWAAELAERNNATPCRMDVYDGIRRMTLDVIGQAGFDHDFRALADTGKPNELTESLENLFHSPDARRNLMFLELQTLIPALKLLPLPGQKALAAAHAIMHSIASQILSESREAILNLGDGEKSFHSKRDLLSILLKANMSASVPAHQRLSDAELIAQIPTFVAAGHETTSNATAWALHSLSLHPATQKKLREELFTISSDNLTMDDLNSLPYLERVVRETLRFHGPVASMDRMAIQDDVLPLSRPYIDTTGKSHETLPVRKGQIIHISILAFNHDEDIWGPDAGEFRPERWENVPSEAGAIPGMPHPNLFSFFAGQTNCIGYRFSLIEMKALLFTLIRAFEFEPAVPSSRISHGVALIRTPIYLDERERGTSLPMILKPVNKQEY